MNNNQHHVEANQQHWDDAAQRMVASGERLWAQSEPAWGLWALPESDLRLLPADMAGMDAIELGCGTAYVSAWMARRGARVMGIDNSSRQLETARRLQTQHGLSLTLVRGDAEAVPFADASFDFAISEYGAAIWCNPFTWIPEAYRLLRPGGELVFLGNHPLTLVCAPSNGAACDERLHAPYFGLHKRDWRTVEIDPGGVEFNLTLAAWLTLFRETGFDVLNYQELQAPHDASGQRAMVSASWGRQWPAEQVWHLRK